LGKERFSEFTTLKKQKQKQKNSSRQNKKKVAAGEHLGLREIPEKTLPL
jgi:hypothetical protein